MNMQSPKEEDLDENEWWDKLKVAEEQQEVVIEKNHGRRGQDTLEDFAFQLGLLL